MLVDAFFACSLCEALCGLQVTVEDNRVTRIGGDSDGRGGAASPSV